MVCGKTPEGGWHCAGTGCLHGICLHDAATPGVPELRMISEGLLTKAPADFMTELKTKIAERLERGLG